MKLTYSPTDDSILDIKQDKRLEVFNHGINNAHPSLVETLIESSVTAKACVDKVAKSIYGKSFGADGVKVVNKDGQSLNEVLRIASRELAMHSNLFLHIGFNGQLKVDSIKVVPSTYCRIGKADDKGYSGKVVVYDNWDKSVSVKISPSKFKWIDRYNPKESVILSQIEEAGGINKYKGQILHIQKDSNAIYSLSDLHPVMEEALLEINSQAFRRRGSEKGFLNTKLMVVKPFASKEQEKDFKRSMEHIQGAHNSGSVLLLESSNASEDLSSEVMLEDLSSPYNDTLFSYSDEQARKNIALAFGVPLGLVDVSDSSLFGNSGELIKSMKLTLWEAKEEERDQIEEAFNKILKGSAFAVQYLKIISPFNTEI